MPLPALGPVRGASGWTHRITQRLGGSGASRLMTFLCFETLLAPQPFAVFGPAGWQELFPRDRMITLAQGPSQRHGIQVLFLLIGVKRVQDRRGGGR